MIFWAKNDVFWVFLMPKSDVFGALSVQKPLILSDFGLFWKTFKRVYQSVSFA